MPQVSFDEKKLGRGLLDIFIRAGLILTLVIFCYRAFAPFQVLMIWSVILAVTLYPIHSRLRARIGNRNGLSATLLIVAAILILLIPAYLLGNSLTESTQAAIATIKAGGLHIPPPAESVAQWPLIGKSLYAFWLDAATNLSEVVQRIAPQFKGVSLKALGLAASAGMGMLMFVGALMVSGIIMAYGEKGELSALKIARRISGPDKGRLIVELCTSTIRAVAQGVIGIAFIQMLLIGIGFVVYGVPGAGLLALGVLLLGIMQLPATLITLPVLAYVLATEGATTATITFSIYTFVAGMADNVLKPMLLGRGVDVPMPVILLGALGGMITSGIIGLFIGPVVLAIGYRLFWQWVDDQPDAPEDAKQDND